MMMMMMKVKVRPCELCNAEAAVFCPSDTAFLCRNCDAKVHEANFLVARHLRRVVCSTCDIFTGDIISGVDRPSACPSCRLSSSSSSSVCISSTSSPRKEYSSSTQRRRRMPKSHLKAGEGVFVNWCGKLGVEGGSVSAATVKAACTTLKARWTALPFRICLAASLWLGLRLTLEKSALTWSLLKRLEHISGVPAKIILAAESKLVRGGDQVDHRRRPELEEGWAEC